MSRSIKVTDETYNKLHLYQLPREPLDHVIRRWLAAWEAVNEIRTTLGPNHPIMAPPKRQT